MAVSKNKEFDDDSKLIVTIVQRGYSDSVISAGKSAGANGGVVIQGKGSGSTEKTFFGFKIDPENEIILMIVPADDALVIMKAIYQATDYQSASRGMVFCLPVSYVSGMTHIKKENDED